MYQDSEREIINCAQSSQDVARCAQTYENGTSETIKKFHRVRICEKWKEVFPCRGAVLAILDNWQMLGNDKTAI
jgi:hypothetical protein